MLSILCYYVMQAMLCCRLIIKLTQRIWGEAGAELGNYLNVCMKKPKLYYKYDIKIRKNENVGLSINTNGKQVD